MEQRPLLTDLREFVTLHRPHDELRANAGRPTPNGYRLEVQAARNATATVPIVIAAVDYDPMARGYIASLAKPGGNVTGVFFRHVELTGKRLQLMKEALPNLRRVAVFWDAISADQWSRANTLAPRLGLKLQGVELCHQPFDFGEALRALLVLMSPLFFRHRTEIVNTALKSRLPTVSGSSQFATDGALMTYGANLDDMFRQAALYIDKILKGAKPADLPVEQPTKFE